MHRGLTKMSNLNFINTDCSDLACHTGTTFEVDLLFTSECTGIPDDLTGYTCTMKIFGDVETDVLDTITADMTESDKGLISFLIPANQTQTYEENMYNYHIELTIGSTINRVAQGYFEVSA